MSRLQPSPGSLVRSCPNPPIERSGSLTASLQSPLSRSERFEDGRGKLEGGEPDVY
jgi:hypothetical protein